MLRATKSTEKDKEETFSLTLPQHAHSQTLHEAAGLARLASPLGDLALVGCRTAVLDVACNTWKRLEGDRQQGLSLRADNEGTVGLLVGISCCTKRNRKECIDRKCCFLGHLHKKRCIDV